MAKSKKGSKAGVKKGAKTAPSPASKGGGKKKGTGEKPLGGKAKKALS
jgi:hypothetical protein